MLSLIRFLGTRKRLVHTGSISSTRAVANFLQHECLNPIRNELPSHSKIESPYELSKWLNEIMARSYLSDEEASAIHNRLIEELCQHEYGISQIHAKKLRELRQPLSGKSILEIVKNNPGRVSTSWELLLKHYESLALLPDELLNSALENTVLSIETKDTENQDLPSMVQSIILLNNIRDKKLVGPSIVEKLVADILETDATCLLSTLLAEHDFPITVFEQRMDVLSDYQIYLLAKNCPFDLLSKNEELLLLAVNVMGKKTKVHLNERETQKAKEVQECFSRVKDDIPENWKVEKIATRPIESAAEFIRLFEQIKAERLDERNLKLAKKLLRIFGVFRGNTKISLELYHSYLIRYPDDSRELMFETFLALAYQSYETGNKELLGYAEAFIPDNAGQSMLANIYRVLILVKSRFDIEHSLQLYNENIESLSKENDSNTNIAPAGLVAEALILSYLSQNDLDFARVIFDGSVREKLVSGPTAIKRIKRYMALYGETVEEGKTQETMKREVQEMLRNI
ncbi:hypothetical protein HG536_0E04150 [Torulaspora globosa]|uniref:Uncharacterized protein n=1 Tax=Torulaspora globosa TaxID=48254 RepID=A0A7G3ZJ18_9SACH|nr:uncharacterized protein HG536_0E04150 [Torulaspora globosa]QLL33504.1 hypothetical protein HG536_0E04150 [Torulaspora globosa]